MSHTFSQPFYVSYAVSAFNALEIFVDALEDQDSAKEEYLEVVVTPYGYDEMVEGLGCATRSTPRTSPRSWTPSPPGWTG